MTGMLLGCAAPRTDGDTTRAAGAATARDATPSAARLVGADIRRLHWLSGTWRGIDARGGGQPFFERYSFTGDSILMVETYRDSTLREVTERSQYALRGGRFETVGNGPQWVVTALDDSSVAFAPVRGARNAFQWRRRDADAWEAELTWPVGTDGSRNHRTYRMMRLQ